MKPYQITGPFTNETVNATDAKNAERKFTNPINNHRNGKYNVFYKGELKHNFVITTYKRKTAKRKTKVKK